MTKVTTGTGDSGYTGLLGEQRVPKYDPRPDTFGTVDEATSALGLARAATKDQHVKELILGYAAVPEREMRQGVRRLAATLHSLFPTPSLRDAPDAR
jgi:hypothetical protein